MTKLRARDGALEDTFEVGPSPTGLAFDRTHIWVTSLDDNTVDRVRLRDAASVKTYRVGAFPIDVVFDGTNIWVSNLNSNTLSKISPNQ